MNATENVKKVPGFSKSQIKYDEKQEKIQLELSVPELCK